MAKSNYQVHETVNIGQNQSILKIRLRIFDKISRLLDKLDLDIYCKPGHKVNQTVQTGQNHEENQSQWTDLEKNQAIKSIRLYVSAKIRIQQGRT